MTRSARSPDRPGPTIPGSGHARHRADPFAGGISGRVASGPVTRPRSPGGTRRLAMHRANGSGRQHAGPGAHIDLARRSGGMATLAIAGIHSQSGYGVRVTSQGSPARTATRLRTSVASSRSSGTPPSRSPRSRRTSRPDRRPLPGSVWRRHQSGFRTRPGHTHPPSRPPAPSPCASAAPRCRTAGPAPRPTPASDPVTRATSGARRCSA